jgi:AraC-like DNA-binding protein
MRCDNQDAFLACEGRNEAFVRRCHAGADELILPLRSDGSLTGVVFLGLLSTPASRAAADRPAPEHDTATLSSALDALRARLMEIFTELGQEASVSWRGPMALIIEEYLRESLATGPSLSELSTRMRLSVSRAGHVVREATGESFNQLVEKRRIDMASELLTRTDGTVGWIASQVGFADTAYFCRYFKKRTGMSPGAFRTENGRPIPV